MLAFEIMMRSGMLFHFDERALVQVQAQRIAELRQALSLKPWNPGQWSLPWQRERWAGTRA
jgi:hypothetical protein